MYSRILTYCSLFLFLSCSLPALSAHEIPVPELTARQEAFSEEAQRLSDWISLLQKGLQEELGISELYIGGGSSIAVLDHIYFGAPLYMNDLDVFVIVGREVTEEMVRRLGEHLESSDFGKYSENDVRNRPRAPANRPVLARKSYVAGWGLHWLHQNGEILDLSLYHSKTDLELNGLLDVDTVMLHLSNQQPLEKLIEAAQTSSYAELQQADWVWDRYDGYTAWTNNNPRVIHWLNIETNPPLHAIRVIRTFAKRNLFTLLEEDDLNLQALISSTDIQNPLQMTRSLLKVLHDDCCAQELVAMADLGIFSKWLPALGNLIKNLGVTELKALLTDAEPISYSRGNALAMGRLRVLLNAIPSDKQLAITYDSLAAYSPETAALWMWSLLVDREELPLNSENVDKQMAKLKQLHADPVIAASLLSRLDRLAHGSVLSPQKRLNLLLRTLLRGTPKEERPEFLSIFSSETSILDDVDLPRLGFFTGVFNPIHLGHVASIQQAINEMLLDEIIIIPTVATGHNERPIEWEHRLRMVEIAAEGIPEASVIPEGFRWELDNSTGTCLERLFSSHPPETEWVQVMGSDSFERFVISGYADKLAIQKRLVMVVQRPGETLYPVPETADPYVYYLPVEKQKGDNKARSSTQIRMLLNKGNKNIDQLVLPGVKTYIEDNSLYQQTTPQLTFVTSNDAKFHLAKNLFPSLRRVNIDLPKIQEQSRKDLLRAKVVAALGVTDAPLIVLESFLLIDCLQGLPDVMTKQFTATLNNDGLADLTKRYHNSRARIITMVGYAEDENHVKLFESSVEGKLISKEFASDTSEVDWQNLFVPDSAECSLSELDLQQRKQLCPTTQALDLLGQSLSQETAHAHPL